MSLLEFEIGEDSICLRSCILMIASPISEVVVIDEFGYNINSASSRHSFFAICLNSSFLVEGEPRQKDGFFYDADSY